MAFKVKNTAERLPYDHGGAIIFYHRIPYPQQAQLFHAHTDRGEIDWRALRLAVAQQAVDGWNEDVHDADDQPLPVPSGIPEEERRTRIAAIVAMFPTELIIAVSEYALADNPETVRKNLALLSTINSALRTSAPDESLPAPTADAPEARKD